MNKEEVLKAFPDYEEITKGIYEEFKSNSKCLIISEDSDEPTIYLKPKQKFPIVFENKNYVVNVDFDGEISIRSKNIQPSWMFSPKESLPLLEQAVAKSKEIRGLK